MARSRDSLLALVLLLAAYAAASFRHLQAADRTFVLDYPLLGSTPRVRVDPGVRAPLAGKNLRDHRLPG